MPRSQSVGDGQLSTNYGTDISLIMSILNNSYFKIRSFCANLEMRIQILFLAKSLSATNARVRLHFAVDVPGRTHIHHIISFVIVSFKIVLDNLEIDI